MPLQAKKCQILLVPTRSWDTGVEELFPRSLHKEPSRLTHFRLLASRIVGINFYYFKASVFGNLLQNPWKTNILAYNWHWEIHKYVSWMLTCCRGGHLFLCTLLRGSCFSSERLVPLVNLFTCYIGFFNKLKKSYDVIVYVQLSFWMIVSFLASSYI